MNSPEKLVALIQSSASALKPRITWGDPLALLGALAEVESDFGYLAVPKHEDGYDYGGRYFRRELWKMWGSLAACSYSSFQIMFPIAVELGLDPETPPWLLNDDQRAIPWVMEYINKRILDPGAQSPEEFAMGWNAGSIRPQNEPISYVSHFMIAYGEVVDKRHLQME